MSSALVLFYSVLYFFAKVCSSFFWLAFSELTSVLFSSVIKLPSEAALLERSSSIAYVDEAAKRVKEVRIVDGKMEQNTFPSRVGLLHICFCLKIRSFGIM